MSEHRESHCGHTIQTIFWKGNLASDRHNADRAQLAIFFPSHGHFVQWSYEWPKEETKLTSDLHALTRVFEAGEQERARKIAALLVAS